VCQKLPLGKLRCSKHYLKSLKDDGGLPCPFGVPALGGRMHEKSPVESTGDYEFA